MISTRELQSMLLSEICNSLSAIKEGRNLACYNEMLGDTSFLLSGILENELEGNSRWGFWLDDSLIHKIKIEGQKIRLWGVMIWGKDGTTKQWTDPFYCEFLIDCERASLQKMVMLFGDERREEVIYEEFAENRTLWDSDYYSNNEWNPSERTWKFVVHC